MVWRDRLQQALAASSGGASRPAGDRDGALTTLSALSALGNFPANRTATADEAADGLTLAEWNARAAAEGWAWTAEMHVGRAVVTMTRGDQAKPSE